MVTSRPLASLGSAKAVAAALLAGSVALVAGCSSGSGNPGTTTGATVSEDGGGSVGCTGGDTYTANMTKPGAKGAYMFTLVQADPAPPSEYGNVWTVKITGASGAPPSAADISVTPKMPLMGHGSNQVPSVSANADGTYSVKDVYFTMPGLWAVTLDVSGAADSGVTSDSAVYTFCID